MTRLPNMTRGRVLLDRVTRALRAVSRRRITGEAFERILTRINAKRAALEADMLAEWQARIADRRGAQ